MCVAPDSEFVPHFFKTPLSLSSALDASTSFSNPEICCVVKTQIFDFPCNVCATSGVTICSNYHSVGEYFSFGDFGIR